MIVLDPGHSVPNHHIDPATGLDVSEYENEPEMRDVFRVAKIVQHELQAAGYRVVLTKKHLYQPMNLAERAHIANRVHADLALSIHDQAGADGGLPFDAANNNVYYQAVGDYRVAENGKKIVFTDQALADLSEKYGEIFQQEREQVEGHTVNLLSTTGYDLGTRGLAAGNIWTVQLLSHVPWIYNEAGGNSAGMVGLDSADKHKYAAGLVASVEHCIPPPR